MNMADILRLERMINAMEKEFIVLQEKHLELQEILRSSPVYGRRPQHEAPRLQLKKG